jgi:hypothetical protein
MLCQAQTVVEVFEDRVQSPASYRIILHASSSLSRALWAENPYVREVTEGEQKFSTT